MSPNSAPSKMVPAWKRETAMFRALASAGFLVVHGLLSDREREKVHRRMMKWAQSAARKVGRVS